MDERGRASKFLVVCVSLGTVWEGGWILEGSLWVEVWVVRKSMRR